jgi:hypothetical protein
LFLASFSVTEHPISDPIRENDTGGTEEDAIENFVD